MHWITFSGKHNTKQFAKLLYIANLKNRIMQLAIRNGTEQSYKLIDFKFVKYIQVERKTFYRNKNYSVPSYLFCCNHQCTGSVY